MDYDDLGQPLHPRPTRFNAKGGNDSQFWTPEEPTTLASGEEAPQADWLGFVRCDVCGRPLPGYDPVPGPESDEYSLSGRPMGLGRRYFAWAWSLSHPGVKHPGRPKEYHDECSLMIRNWDRWVKAEQSVRFDPVYGTEKIKGWQRRLQEMRNTAFGSARFSPEARRKLFARPKRDSRPSSERKSRRQPRR